MSLPRLDHATHIADQLNELAAKVKTRSRASLTDANHILETIATRFFNALFGWDLVNLNTQQANYPAADLGDRTRRVAIQVTNEDGSNKIKRTTSKAVEHNLGADFDRLIVFFLLPRKPAFPKQFKQPPNGPNIETLDIADLLNQLKDETDLDVLARARHVLDDEMCRIPATDAGPKIDISRIVKYAPAELIGREEETALLDDAWARAVGGETERPRVLTFVAMGGEGKTSLVAKWVADLANRDWPSCDAAFAWSFYSQGTREQVAASSDLFLAEALTFFGDPEMAGSPLGAFEKGRRLAELVGRRRALLVLDGVEPLQYSPTSPLAGQLKDQGLAELLKGLAASNHGLCVVTTRYSLPDLKAFRHSPLALWRSCGLESPSLWEGREASLSELTRGGLIWTVDVNRSAAPPRSLVPRLRPSRREGEERKSSDSLSSTAARPPLGRGVGGEGTAPEVPLLRLSNEAGVRLLKTLGVRPESGTAEDFETLVKEVKGHALTLNLLGTFLRDAHGGDIRRRDLVKLEEADAEEQRGHAFRVMDAYVRWLESGTGFQPVNAAKLHGQDARATANGQRALAILRLLGLFDRPATGDCLAALWQPPAIAGLTEPLVGMTDAQRNIALTRLEDAKLLTVNRDAAGTLLSLDAHPLIREYFAVQVRSPGFSRSSSDVPPKGGTTSDAWRAAHRRVYEHLCATTQEGDQPKLEDLEPLFQAVGHGCQAGQYVDTLDSVYHTRIARWDPNSGGEGWHYSARVLGAWSSTLGCVSGFFSELWKTPVSELHGFQREVVLQQAGWLLRSEGRFTEAANVLEESRREAEKSGHSHIAGVACRNLNQIYEVMGKLGLAHEVGKAAVEFATSSQREPERVKNLTRLAGTLSIMGRLTEAEKCFSKAGIGGSCEQATDSVKSGYEFFLLGDLKVRQGKYEEAIAVAERALYAAERINAAPIVPALANLVKGHARLAQNYPPREDDLKIAMQFFNACMELLRKNGEVHQLPRGLLGRALCHLEAGSINECLQDLVEAREIAERSDMRLWLTECYLLRARLRARQRQPELVRADLNEAWEIAARGPMRLLMADVLLYRARLFGTPHPASPQWGEEQPAYPWESPAADLAAAEKLIRDCGYHRRDEELADAKAAIVQP